MKKLGLIALVFLLLAPIASVAAQDRAIGLRFGGGNFVGAEISYQTPFGRDRLELDLGIKSTNHWSYWNLTGIYQWVMPIEAGFNWYLGLGPSLGNSSYSGPYERKDGVYLALALNAGIEYNFAEIPLQLSIDTRPELVLVDVDSRGWFGLALGVRYKF
ncbi:hypothetical protein [Alkaliflexus imshenetskii]|uniref:hypothetical protein n=1 Tax=Alkaliflexus imshenetskii TaxID=286730 RepID=UPI00047DEE2D|nr:hypothetical protein [Alkaliflexus imshenetskii]